MTWDQHKTFRLLGWILILAFVYFFTAIVVYLIIASMIGVVAQPVMTLLSKFSIKKRHLPASVNAAITLLLILVLMLGLVAILIPVLNAQATDLGSVDFNLLGQEAGNLLINIENELINWGILSSEKELETRITLYLTDFVTKIQVESVFSAAISVMGSFFICFGSIFFMSFFFIKDDDLFRNIVFLFVPENNKRKTELILLKIKKSLSRYFIGIMVEVTAMMILISVGGLLLGVKNALLIGFLGGLLNVIPYLGPLIAMLSASVLVSITNLHLGLDHTLLMMGAMVGVIAVSNMIDNFLLQPIIYSNSVNAHPLEIFIVIIVGGTLGGALGMIVAIPIYTIIRIVVKEFLSDHSFVKRSMREV